MDPATVLAVLRDHEAELRAAGIVRLSLFGSTVRNEAGIDSDIDLLAAFDAGRPLSLLDVIGIECRLSDLLGRKVDLVEEGTLKPRVRRRVEPEIVRAFQRSRSTIYRYPGQHRPHQALCRRYWVQAFRGAKCVVWAIGCATNTIPSM
jgi:predicted nucleotidyltransferase